MAYISCMKLVKKLEKTIKYEPKKNNQIKKDAFKSIKRIEKQQQKAKNDFLQ